MSGLRLLLPMVIILSTTLNAEDDQDDEIFNNAWRKYQAAVQSPDVELEISTAREVLAIGDAIFGDDDERKPVLMSNLGVALKSAGLYAEAKEVLLRALHLSGSIHGDDSLELVHILDHLTDTDQDYRAIEKRRYYTRALKIVKKESGEDSDDYAALALRAGASLYGTYQVKMGERLTRTAYDYNLREFGSEEYRTGIAAFYLGKYAFTKRKYDQASNYLSKSLAGLREDTEDSLRYQLQARAMLVVSLESDDRSDEATEHCVAIGRLSQFRGTDEYEPLFRLIPRYPKVMRIERRQGFVDVTFTVDELGYVRNPKVVGMGPGDKGFEDAVLDAVRKFRYAPRFEDGLAVPVDDVKTRFTFTFTK